MDTPHGISSSVPPIGFRQRNAFLLRLDHPKRVLEGRFGHVVTTDGTEPRRQLPKAMSTACQMPKE